MARYYVDRIMPNGKHRPVTPGGKRIFGPRTLRWVRRRAKKRHHRIIVGVVHSKRDKVRAWWRWAVRHEPAVHYRQIRPIPLKRGRRMQLPLTTDCSGATTIAAYYAGAPDPNGNKYDGSGWTGDMLQSSPEILRKYARPGDMVVFGDGGGTHVVVLDGHGREGDPFVFSHGQEAGPIRVRLSVQEAAHPGQRMRFLSAQLP